MSFTTTTKNLIERSKKFIMLKFLFCIQMKKIDSRDKIYLKDMIRGLQVSLNVIDRESRNMQLLYKLT
jgi:hypothetical protein